MLINADFVFGAIIIFVGLAVELIGWKLHQQIVGVSGFVVGLVVGDFLGSQVLQIDYFLWRILILAAFSVGFFVLFFVYLRISIAVTSGIVGALIVSGFTSSRTIAEWSLNYVFFQTNYNYPVLIIVFAISSYAGYRFFKLGYIILSTGIGSILVAYGGIISGLWTYSYLGIFLLLSLLLGVIVQLSQEGIIRERRLQVKDFKYCRRCGNLIEKDSVICSRCHSPISYDDRA
jgi:hypothetical protein